MYTWLFPKITSLSFDSAEASLLPIFPYPVMNILDLLLHQDKKQRLLLYTLKSGDKVEILPIIN